MDNSNNTQSPVTPPLNQSTQSEPPVFAQSPVPKKKKKIGLIVGIVAAILLVMLGTGVVLGYTLWYQNPQKVVTDAIIHMASATSASYKGVIDLEQKDGTFKGMKVTIEGKNTIDASSFDAKLEYTDADNKTHTFSGNGVYDKDGNMFLKIDKVKEIIATYETQLGTPLPEQFDPIIEKVDGNWIKITASDLEDFSKEYADTQKCYTDLVKKVQNDTSIKDEISKLYKDNQFIVVKKELGVKDGNIGYELDADDALADRFAEGFEKTKLFSELKKCDEDFKLQKATDKKDSDGSTTSSVTVWISQFGHELRKAEVSGDSDTSKGTLTFEPSFNKPVIIEAPKDVVPLSELKSDIETLFGSSMSSAASTQDNI